VGSGRFGVPIAGGFDVDGDGNLDFAMASMRASPQGRTDTSQVFLVFGDATTGNSMDIAVANTRILEIFGEAIQENTGSEIWMNDVTGDGLGDLIIGRQNYSSGARTGAGAVTVVVGNPMLATFAASGTALDLGAIPAGLSVITFIGAQTLDRLGMWMRTGDINGDGIVDMALGADQADVAGATNSGTVYVVLGGLHLDTTTVIDMANFGSPAIVGNVAKLNPPPNANDFHFGSSLAVGDLDGNGLSEVYISASLNRAGGTLPAAGAPAGSANGSGNNPGGSLFIFWDDNFPSTTPWPAGLEIDYASPLGAVTRIDGSSRANTFNSDRFGEELLPGADYNGDGELDLFVGDISGNPAGLSNAGLGHVLFNSSLLRNETFDIDTPPSGINVSHILGPRAGAIFGDTAAQGDFDGGGLTDLAVGSPHDSPSARSEAGSAQILWGQASWPEVIDLSSGNRPSPSTFAITDILGAAGGTASADHGDTLMYSGTSADIDGDGRLDLIINEMQGNGVGAGTEDVGNLIIVSGSIIPR
jgi:hypothetical protein